MNQSAKIYSVIMVLVVLWCMGIIAAPLLKYAGSQNCADAVYSFYSRICHQDDARSFHIFGEKFCVCIRCTAIYSGFLAGLLLMPLFGSLKPPSDKKAKIFFIVLFPMLADVILNFSGIHTSTTLTRVSTGVIFGGAMPFYIVPIFIEAWSQLMQRKKIHLLYLGVCKYVRKTQ
jgi:uncharacterized membrane protein